MGSVRNFQGDPYLNGTTVPFDNMGHTATLSSKDVP